MSDNKVNIEQTVEEIQSFFNGSGKVQHIVNVETYYHVAEADCYIQDFKGNITVERIPYTNFIYIKDLEKMGYKLYNGDPYLTDVAKSKHGIKMRKLNTGKHPRLENGYCYIISSTKSYNSITTFLLEGGVDLKAIRKNKTDGDNDIIYSLKLQEQFFISTGNRLFKGFEEYSDINKLIFDIETTGLNPNTSRIIQIGVRNRLKSIEHILEVDKVDDDASEGKIIMQFIVALAKINPSITAGYNSEFFDFDFILKRTDILVSKGIKIPVKVATKYNTTTYKYSINNGEFFTIERRANSSVKFGGNTEKYVATSVFGRSIIDILFAVKRAAAINPAIKQTSLKEICKFAKIAKKDRMYIKGDKINQYWKENKIFVIDAENNNYKIIPNRFQEFAKELFLAQTHDKENDKYIVDPAVKSKVFTGQPEFLDFIKEAIKDVKKFKFISGKQIVNRYLLDDLWETEQVDDQFNQSSFLLAKIVPTYYSRICTMGSAAIWNLLMVTWSYQNDLAIPLSDVKEKFVGGLARCYKKGWSKNIRKLDFAQLYPSLQLTYDIFPTVDITGVLKKMLTYLTVERNKYKKLKKKAEVDHDEKLEKYYDAKQQPIKVLNNSLFGALGSNIAFNWGDNICASRITCTGRLHLRKMIKWFKVRDCVPLLAVTDGVNFSYPDFTYLDMNGNRIYDELTSINDAWQYGGKTGIAALIEKYNDEEMIKPHMKVDDDGHWVSSLNLSRINYANLTPEGKLKITGNTIKSKVMPEYIEEFINKGLQLILEGKGAEFVEYYYGYIENIHYRRIPLKKIASKKKYKHTILQYLNRGVNKNKKPKAKMAYMELVIEDRNRRMIKLYEEMGFVSEGVEFEEIRKVTQHLLPPEPEIGTTIYYVNSGLKKSHGDSQMVFDEKLGRERLASSMVSAEDLEENPNMLGEYNTLKYLAAFNTRVKSLLEGFEEKVRKKIIVSDPAKREYFTEQELVLKNFDNDDIEESMILEQGEIDFWNRTGLNPYKIYDGFTVPEEYPLYTQLYDEKLKKGNELMKATGNKEMKSVNDPLNEDDFVLYKNHNQYDLYIFKNGWVRLAKSGIMIPETETEKMLREKMEEMQKPINIHEPHDYLVNRLMKPTEIEEMEEMVKKFKKKFKISDEQKLSQVMVEEGRSAIDLLYDWIEIETQDEEEEESEEEGDY